MEEMKRMVDNYEVVQAISIGKVEVLLGIDETNTERPYMVCTCTRNNSLGVEQFYAIADSADYLEACMTLFPACNGNWRISKKKGPVSRYPYLPLPKHNASRFAKTCALTTRLLSSGRNGCDPNIAPL
ncbi:MULTISPECIES: hypothetical protein [Paenibacillus]|uniref:hypothetical protein n=1 Tax=Paenibacillus TaxID=44249 RepID=UPI000B2A6177|nr:hypothetical protein [Paenibacillus sp. IHBB 10380]